MVHQIETHELTLSKVFSSGFEFHIPDYQGPTLGTWNRQSSSWMIWGRHSIAWATNLTSSVGRASQGAGTSASRGHRRPANG